MIIFKYNTTNNQQKEDNRGYRRGMVNRKTIFQWGFYSCSGMHQHHTSPKQVLI